MYLWGRNLGLTINTSGIFGNSVSISQVNTVNSKYGAGFNLANGNQTPNGSLTTSVDSNYYLAVPSDPNWRILSGTLNNINREPVRLAVSSVTGLGYIKSLSFSLTPHSLANANVSYVNYENMTGTLGESYTANAYAFGINERAANGASVYILNKDGSRVKVYSIEYSASINWEPKYRIGQKTPYAVNFIKGEENITIELDEYDCLPFYGDSISTGFLGSGTAIHLRNLSTTGGANTFHINIHNTTVNSIESSFNPTDIVKHKYKFTKYY